MKSRKKATRDEPAAETESPQPEPQTAPAARYRVVVNNGNEGGAAIVDLEELGAIASRVLCEQKARSVALTVTPIIVQGELGAERADGIK